MLVIAVAGLPAAPLLAARVWVTIFFLGTTEDFVVIDHLLKKGNIPAFILAKTGAVVQVPILIPIKYPMKRWKWK